MLNVTVKVTLEALVAEVAGVVRLIDCTKGRRLLTATVKVRVTVLFAAWPSFTVTVIVAAPLAPGTGM